MSDAATAGARLVRQLERSAAIAGCTFDVVTGDSQDHSVGLFQTARHWLSVVVAGDAARLWLDRLDEQAVHVPGHVLAHCAVGTVEARGSAWIAEIEAQTVREA